MVKFILIKSPNEWAAAKQDNRDELVVYFYSSTICVYMWLKICIYRMSLYYTERVV